MNEGLKRRREQLERLIAELEAGLDAGRGSAAVVSLDDPIGRLSRIDALHSQEMSLGLQEGLRRRLEMARRALEAVEKGSYGVCVACRRPIAEERLDALPETPLCVECSA